MTDAPERIWLPLAHAEDAANMPAQGLIEYTRADLAPSPEVVRGLVEALRLQKAWADSENSGPDYGGQTRDTHPDGERIWQQWWDANLSLCDRANQATDAALAAYEKETRHD